MIKTIYRASGGEENVTPDGRKWREATPRELAELPPEALVCFRNGDPKPAGEYADLRLPGNYPFLAGIAALLPVYVEVTA